jgi:hypothetical protein
MVQGTMTSHAAFQSGDYLAVRIHASALATAERTLHVAFMLDISDSMSGERLDSVKRTLEAARGLFQESDRITAVTFGDTGTVLAADVPPSVFYDRVSTIETDGCTNLSGGLEALFEQRSRGPWDAVILLTDGHINVGLTSIPGLMAMATGIGTMPFYTLGYGADHNQRLLRELALTSCGSYTYADSDEVLPVAIGDMISGLRTRVWSDVRVSAPGAECMELGRGRIGGVVAGRDYWVVYRGTTKTVTVHDGMTDIDTLSVESVADDDVIVGEQVFRCRVAALMNQAAATDPHQIRNQLTVLQNELTAAPAVLRARPLMLRMTGQIAELLAISTPANTGVVTADLLTRLNSNAVYFSMQRGTQSSEDPDMFCSPVQRITSTQVHNRYHGM